jgi:adenosine kinase
MSRRPIVVSGSLAFDRIVDFPGRFRREIRPEKLHVLSVSFVVPTMREHFGGTAGNIAYNLALLGERPVVVGSVGKDFSAYKKWLQRHSVALALRTMPKQYTATAMIMNDQENNQIAAFHPGALSTPAWTLARRGPRPAMVVSAPGNKEDFLQLAAWAKKNRIPSIIDPGQIIPLFSGAELRRAIAGSFLLIANDYEMSTIQERTGLSAIPLARTVRYVVTTLGRRGSVIVGDGRTHRIPVAPPKNSSDPTGAGDAYRAGLLAGIRLGLPIATAGRLASVVSCYTVEQYGTQTHRFTLPQLAARYKRAFGTSFLKEKGRVNYEI